MPIYGEKEYERHVMLTDSCWNQLQELAQKTGATSVQDFLERLSRINPDAVGKLFPFDYDPD